VLYDTYFRRIYTYIRYRVSDPQTSDDLTEQVFETLLKHLGQYAAERGPFEAWLFAIVRNVVNQHFRRSRLPWLNWEIFSNRPAAGPLPEETALQRETRAELLAALARLDQRARDLVGLKFVARLTNRQIAAMTGLKESHVGVILFRAIAQVRLELQAAESGIPMACQGQEQNHGRA
jgi:RNA polymerase sigma-70 factor (ECF subfamily)